MDWCLRRWIDGRVTDEWKIDRPMDRWMHGYGWECRNRRQCTSREAGGNHVTTAMHFCWVRQEIKHTDSLCVVVSRRTIYHRMNRKHAEERERKEKGGTRIRCWQFNGNENSNEEQWQREEQNENCFLLEGQMRLLRARETCLGTCFHSEYVILTNERHHRHTPRHTHNPGPSIKTCWCLSGWIASRFLANITHNSIADAHNIRSKDSREIGKGFLFVLYPAAWHWKLPGRQI